MSHSSHSSAPGLPAITEFPVYYWATVGTAIGIATIVNTVNYGLYRQRLLAAKTGDPAPAKPKSWLFIGIATLFALVREASNFSFHISIKDRIWRLPTVGRTSLVLANFVVVIVLCFYGFDLNNRWTRESIAFRCGHVALGQIPLIFLLAGKNNLIGYLTGVSHERLNWLHRWCARGLLLTATLHMGYLFADWAPYDYVGVQLRTNQIAQRGIIAWAMLLWIAISSMTPIRGWCYEIFVLQHLVSFAVFTGFVYLHIPAETRTYIWIPVGLFWFDRVVRGLRLLYANIALFHPKQRNAGQMSGLWACKAEFTPLPHNTTRIVIPNPTIKWSPGQHVFLSCHSLTPFQSHPFTIASIPKDGKMEFLVKSESGGTRHFFRHAEKTHGLPASNRSCTKTVTIEGPYGSLRPLRQFDSVVLLAGSTGATFTFPLLRDIVEGWRESMKPGRDTQSLLEPQFGAVTRHVRFVWVVKSRGQLSWFADQLSTAYSEFELLQERLRGIKLELTVYVTCDESFTEEHNTLLSNVTATKPKKVQDHSTVEFRNRSSSTEEEKLFEAKEPVEEVTNINSSVTNKNRNTCGPNGECCCKTAVDETNSPDSITPCYCGALNESSKTSVRSTSHRSSSSPSIPTKQKPLVHSSVLVFSGRPKTRDIIRRSLEQALGESAVVVCGPRGLVADVKQDVCSLSDERAVHKGTGAQGIYLHTESFGY